MGMKINFKVNASELNAALDIVSIVSPRPFDKQGQSGYLFVIRGPKAYIYSRDSQHVSRAAVELSEVEGEGAFIYPSQHIDAFRCFQNETLTFSVTGEGEVYTVSYHRDGGRKAEKPSYDPKFMQSCDKDLEGATNERSFSSGVLREALAMSHNFHAKATDTQKDDKLKTIQIFDKNYEVDDPKNPGQKVKPYEKGDGNLFAANGIQAFTFYSEAFENLALTVHAQHLPLFEKFLSKCGDTVTLKTTPNMTFAVDGDRALGWVHHSAMHPKFAYYKLETDQIVVRVVREAILNELRYLKTELDAKRDKIKVIFADSDKPTFQFQVVEGNSKATSDSVVVDYVTEETRERKSFALNVNIDHFMGIFEGCKSNEVMLRVTLVPASDKRPKDAGMFRTIDQFLMDKTGKVVGDANVAKRPEGSFVCRVTRFTPSKD